MTFLEPYNQTRLFGLELFLKELINLDKKNILPNKIILSGQKGLGKSTMAFHFINYILSKGEEFNYNLENFEINPENHSYKTVLNKSNPNLILIDILSDKKTIDINQIRELISKLNKSSFNEKPRFVLIDNIEFLNVNSVNALLKILEEPSTNTHYILIHNNKKVLSTLLSRCVNFKISLSHEENMQVANHLLNTDITQVINKDLINYYHTPGMMYNMYKFSSINDYDLSNINLKDFLKKIIREKHYKKDNPLKYLIYDFVEFYFSKIEFSFRNKVNYQYDYFLKKISDTKKFNLDEESLFVEFEDKILNG